MAGKWPTFKTVGPTIMKNNKNHGTCLFEIDSEACLKWLDKRDFRSVVYVSLGSVAILGQEQMDAIARALISSNCYFLWMVRASEESKLPADFRSETSESEKGLIVNWCPQLEVLEHQAVACFVTHCGWNSTLESLSLGVPVVAIPQMIDQMTNAKFLADVWQSGVRVKANNKGIATREEIEMCIKEVTEGERAEELRRNAEKWRDLAQEAITEGGSSHNNIHDFISQLSSM